MFLTYQRNLICTFYIIILIKNSFVNYILYYNTVVLLRAITV